MHRTAAKASSSSVAAEIPAGLQSLLLDFTVSVLVDRPQDLVDYAVRYFIRLRETREDHGQGRDRDQGRLPASVNHRNNHRNQRHPDSEDSVLSYDEDEDDQDEDEQQEDEEDEPMLAPPAAKYGRRKSVFAEHYNPEEDDDDGEKVLYPKSDEQRQRLSEAVKDIFLFRSLDTEQMQDVLDAMFERKVVTNEYVIMQGDDGDNFYIIESGIYNIVVSTDTEEKLVGTYDNRGSFGELALMYNMPRAATIQALTDGSLWAMDRHTFRRILLKNAFKKRKMYETLLENVPMLKALEAYERMNLADALYPRTFQDKELIIKQGDAAYGMYFVEDGTVVITILGEKETEEREVSRISKGGYFGELALVTHKPRAASARAEGPVRLAFLDVQAFERLLGPCMEIMKRNIEDYEEQLIKIFGSKTNLSDAR